MRRFAAVFVSVVLAGCASGPQHHGSRERLVYIAATKVPCQTAGGAAQCLQFRDEPKQAWQPVTVPVDGLDWQPGNEYLVKVTEIEVRHAPADGPSVHWQVQKVVEQHPVDKPPLP